MGMQSELVYATEGVRGRVRHSNGMGRVGYYRQEPRHRSYEKPLILSCVAILPDRCSGNMLSRALEGLLTHSRC
jgi:hypothetical protein